MRTTLLAESYLDSFSFLFDNFFFSLKSYCQNHEEFFLFLSYNLKLIKKVEGDLLLEYKRDLFLRLGVSHRWGVLSSFKSSLCSLLCF